MRQIALQALKISLLIRHELPRGAALILVRRRTAICCDNLPLRNIFTNTPLAEEVLDVAVSLINSRSHLNEAVGALCLS